MSAVSIDGAMTTGHGKYKPTQVRASQTKFTVSGIPILLNGDLADYHGHSPVGQCIATSTKLFVGGRAVVRIGDPLSDGDAIAIGSPKLFSN